MANLGEGGEGVPGPSKNPPLPLTENTLSEEEIAAAVESIKSGQLTMGKRVSEFESVFAKRVGAKFAVMVNSGSSANLLAVSAVCQRKLARLSPGDEVLLPAVCWSTSLFPLLQHGLKPKFVDINPRTLNVDVSSYAAAISSATKAILAVHVLGNSSCLTELTALCAERRLVLIEDSCEALGTTSDGRVAGAVGDFGTYSFYFSHHMTTGEGGMVVCHDEEDYNLLRSLRSHGWVRDYDADSKASIVAEHADVDERFLFINMGYNLRPMEVQAAIGLHQIQRLDVFNANRNHNFLSLVDTIRGHAMYAGQFSFIEPGSQVSPCWFGFPCLLSEPHQGRKKEFLRYLTERGVDNRPILTGNFMRQPCVKAFVADAPSPEHFVGAEMVHKRGFFVGLPSLTRLDDGALTSLATAMLEFFG